MPVEFPNGVYLSYELMETLASYKSFVDGSAKEALQHQDGARNLNVRLMLDNLSQHGDIIAAKIKKVEDQAAKAGKTSADLIDPNLLHALRVTHDAIVVAHKEASDHVDADAVWGRLHPTRRVELTQGQFMDTDVAANVHSVLQLKGSIVPIAPSVVPPVVPPVVVGPPVKP